MVPYCIVRGTSSQERIFILSKDCLTGVGGEGNICTQSRRMVRFGFTRKFICDFRSRVPPAVISFSHVIFNEVH